MRKQLLIIFLLCILQSSAQDVYYVTIIGGEVFKQNNHKVEIGDKLLSNEKLTFTSKTAFLIVLNEKGRYEITPYENKIAKANELITLLIKDNLKLHASNVRLSSRATGDDISLESYFKPLVVTGVNISNKILIIDELKIPIKNMGYSNVDNNENFFFLQWIDTSRNGLNKKLIVRNDTLVLTKEDFTIVGKSYSQGDGILALGYVSGYSTQKNVTKITEIRPVFLSREEARKIVDAIKYALPDLPQDELIKEIYTELYYIYGKPDEQLIESLL
jgi:hypothetical protein